jgi:DUF2905 family protein
VDELAPIGRTLIVLGVVVAVVGLVIVVGPRIPFLGRLPGDIRIDRDGLVVFIPLGTMLLVSVIASIILAVLGRR